MLSAILFQEGGQYGTLGKFGMVSGLAAVGQAAGGTVIMDQDASVQEESLPYPAVLHREAAEGWLMLGNATEALAELDLLSAADRKHLSVLSLDWRAWTAVGEPQPAWLAARQWCQDQPGSPEAWICQANSLRDLRGARAAAELLLCIVERFPSEAVIPYNLACFSAQESEWNQACVWLVQAFEIEPSDQLKEFALVDPDLKPLWNQIAENFTVTLRRSGKKAQRR
jgi:hypothetical protein